MEILTAIKFVRSNWKWFLIAGLVVALGVSRLQLTITRNAFDSYKIKAVAEAQKLQKKYDEKTVDAEIIYVESAPKIITEIKTVTKWIIRNVENVAACPGPEFVRLFNQSITGNGLTEADTTN